MVLWYGLLVLFAFLSFLIDLNYLPQQILRPVWDIMLLATGVFLLVRMKTKAKEGLMEKMQKEYQELSSDIEKKHFSDIMEHIRKLEDRITSLEGNR